MKNFRNVLAIAAIAATGFAAQSCDTTTTDPVVTDKSLVVSNLVDENNAVDMKSMAATIFVTTDSLTPAQTDGLLLMREEEKMAYDVYTSFYGTFSLSIFDKISQSELRHADKVLELINFYGLTDPALVDAGLFNNADLQALYNNLIAQGSTSEEAALQVGALIEETDIQDLKELLLDTTNLNLTTVYTHLLNASYRHLKSFAKVLETSYAITYAPQVLDAATYAEILAMELPGHHGGGQGGHHGGNGTCDSTATGGGHHGGNGTCDSTATGGGTCDSTGVANQGNPGGHGHGHGHGQGGN